MIERDVWPIDKQEDLSALSGSGVEIDKFNSVWEVLDATYEFLTQLRSNSIASEARISPSTIIEGAVVIRAGVVVMENSKIVGPAYISENVIIGNGSLVRNSFIGADCVVGYLVDVVRSFIGNSSWFSRVHVADSIIGSGVNLGGGTVLASLRFDHAQIDYPRGRKYQRPKEKLGAAIGSRTQVGANCTILPGVKVGKDCLIGPGLVVSEDIKDGMYCRLKQEIIYRENTFTYNPSVRDNLRKKILGG